MALRHLAWGVGTLLAGAVLTSPAPPAHAAAPAPQLPPYVEVALDGDGRLIAAAGDAGTYILRALGQGDWYRRLLDRPGPHSVAISTRTMQIAGSWGEGSGIEGAMAACGGPAQGCRPYLDRNRVVWVPQPDDPVPVELVPPPSPDADTATPAGALTGGIGSAARCAREPPSGSLWVPDESGGGGGGGGTCLRFRAGRLAADNPVALLFLDGDEVFALLARERRGVSGIAAVTLSAMKRPPAADDPRWRNLAERTDLPFVILSRPGTGGSSGNQWRDGKTRRETLALDRAMDLLAARLRIGRWAVAGQSGGAAVTANLLARRGDIACAALASGPLALKAQYIGQGARDDMVGLLDDPLDSVGRIDPAGPLRVFVVSDRQDSLVPVRVQQPWVEAALARGLDVHHLVGDGWGGGVQHHVLAWQAVDIATACAHGTATPDILRAFDPAASHPTQTVAGGTPEPRG